MNHYASRKFWECYRELPIPVQRQADRNYELLKSNSDHPSLHFKKIGEYFSVRVGLRYRALGTELEDGVLWFWIGSHAEYDKLLAYINKRSTTAS
jgi:hypothetical protein